MGLINKLFGLIKTTNSSEKHMILIIQTILSNHIFLMNEMLKSGWNALNYFQSKI